MYFDTHCHLNFEAFEGRVEDVINEAKKVGINKIVIPGTDVPTSKKAIEIAEKFEGVYTAVGIHPHHVFEIYNKSRSSATEFLSQRGPLHPKSVKNLISSLSSLLSNPKVVAIGEIGLDRHIYQKTKYPDYKIAEEFVELQKQFLVEQIKLAAQYKKALIFHNREAKKDFLEVLGSTRGSTPTDYHSVFHCCEPDPELLQFAKDHKMFIGVDGDITYYKEKQEWIKTVPLEMLVLETDSPFLTPQPVKLVVVDPRVDPSVISNRQGNEPKNIPLIAEFVAKLKGISVEEVAKQTTENARRLFKISNF